MGFITAQMQPGECSPLVKRTNLAALTFSADRHAKVWDRSTGKLLMALRMYFDFKLVCVCVFGLWWDRADQIERLASWLY